MNSSLDIVAKLVVSTYDSSDGSKFTFTKLINSDKKMKIIGEKGHDIKELLLEINESKERDYVRKYCNEIKHARALFNSASCLSFDHNTKELNFGFEVRGFNNKNKREIHWLHNWAPELERYYRKNLCQVGCILLTYLGEEPTRITSDFMKYLHMAMDIDY